jgi:ABC-type phosphate transport system auxiliary subunit
MGQLRKDRDMEVVSLSHSVDTICEQLNDRMSEQIGVAQKQIERVSQEMNTRTLDLAADLSKHITQTNNDAVAVRQEMAELGEQISPKVTDRVKTVPDNVIECRNQILAEKESSVLNF